MRGRIAGLALVVVLTACFDDFQLTAANLDIGPDPAVPGDQVVAAFNLVLIPKQPYTVILTIDNQEHSRVTNHDDPPLFYTIELGDAAGLIATYGEGVHSARVEVVAEDKNESSRTQSKAFELRSAAPPEQ